MVERNKTVCGLLVVAIVCGVVAGRGATQAPTFFVPKADCQSRACNSVAWADPPADSAGNPLPAGATCTMSGAVMSFCVADPVLTCTATASIANGCAGSYTLPGQPNVFFPCYQGINKC